MDSRSAKAILVIGLAVEGTADPRECAEGVLGGTDDLDPAAVLEWARLITMSALEAEPRRDMVLPLPDRVPKIHKKQQSIN